MNQTKQIINQKVTLSDGFREVCILGAGTSGTGAALLAKHLGFSVFLSDKGEIQDKFKAELEANEIEYEEGKHDIERILKADIVIKSPGIPEKVQLIKDLKKQGTEVIGEIEFASRYTNTKIIAITGSNGKTTTTTLTHHLLKTADFQVEMGGNIGFSFARLVLEERKSKIESRENQEESQDDSGIESLPLKKVLFPKLREEDLGEVLVSSLPLLGKSFPKFREEDLGGALSRRASFYILEISSFQLDDCVHFKPNIAMLLNITPDHLDRYDYKFENYAASKFQIAQNQDKNDDFILNENLKHFEEKITKIKAKKHFVQAKNYESGILNFGNIQFSLKNTVLKGLHNYYNAYSAAEAALLAGSKPEDIQRGFETFKNVEHRLEFVAKINGIEYINDSKATNVDSVFYALGAMEKPTILILGGTDKGNDYDQIADLVRQKVKAIVCMGVDNSPILNYFKAFGIPIKETRSAKEAVETATNLAIENDVVLLSPACASFDLFKNYEDRGNQYKSNVMMLGY